MVMDQWWSLHVLSEPLCKSPARPPYVFFSTVYPTTLEPIDHSTLLQDGVSVFWVYQEVLDGFPSFEIHILQIFLQLSTMPWMYGTTMYGLLLLPLLLVVLVVPWLVFVFFLWWMLALDRAQFGYLHLFRALLRWSSSSCSRCWLEQTVFALCFTVLITLNLADRWWWPFHCKNWSICVAFLYTDVNREPSDWGITIVSKKGMDPSVLASSVVKWMDGSTMLMWFRKPCFLSASMTTKISSTYPFQTFGGHSAVLMALFSKSSMQRLATMGLMGDPIAAPCNCSKNLPWNWK